MNVEDELKKDGIKVIKPLDALSITLIAKFISEKFISNLPFYRFNYHELFSKIKKINMYIADIPEGKSEANYFYKNSSIYFKQGLSMDQIKELAVHEFIHYFQEVKDNKGILYRLGLCDFSKVKVHNMALNEAAVQLITSKVLNKDIDSVKYYDIQFSTNSPSYYPMICNLVNQMAYIVGENILFDSTLYSNDRFKNSFIKLCGQKTYNRISKNLDKILCAEEKIIIYTSKLENNELNEKDISKISCKIINNKKIIKDIFIQTQNFIFTSYFNNKLNALYSSQDIEDYRKKLYNYKDLLGITDNYTYFNDYYINRMTQLDSIYESFDNKLPVVYKKSFLQILFSKIVKLFNNKLVVDERN